MLRRLVTPTPPPAAFAFLFRSSLSSHDPSSPIKEGSPVHSELPFDFRYSYSEAERGAHPIGVREHPGFSPFGLGRLDRRWNGVCAPAGTEVDRESLLRARDAVIGDPFSDDEVAVLVERYRHSDCARQIHLANASVHALSRLQDGLDL